MSISTVINCLKQNKDYFCHPIFTSYYKMIVCKTRLEIESEVNRCRALNQTVGFVPTMGALHEGHISLVEKSKTECDITVVSIFVNPIQFNNPNDLTSYPRTLENDLKLLEDVLTDIVFVPDVNEMYPEGIVVKEHYDFGLLESVMEGEHRPGHFNGVAVVVKRLFDLVNPNKAFFGLKDFQQLAVISSLVKQLNLPIEIVPCDIVREEDGLAMSSRNVRLTSEQRISAVEISQTLFKAQVLAKAYSIEELKSFVIEKINTVPLLQIEYFDIVDSINLQSVSSWDESKEIIGCIAVNVGEVRLIDNILFL